MLEIDGSMGEGGGQILRTALSLSLSLRRPFHIAKIRLGRSNPGLQRQHLTSVLAAAAIGRADVTGARLGATELSFTPKEVVAGAYRFDIGSAGSTTLLLQAILLPLMLADSPSRVQLIGGTHNAMSPTFEFLRDSYLPLLKQMGGDVELDLVRPGFYPCGGGEIHVRIHPVPRISPLNVLERGKIKNIEAVSLLSRLPGHIAERELDGVAEGLGVDPDGLHTVLTDQAYCPGNVLQVTVRSEFSTAVFSAIGQRGVPAETVAEKVVQEVRRYLDAGVPIGVHLADQLLLPLAFAGKGAYLTLKPDRHTLTNIEVIRRFMPLMNISSTELGADRWRIEIGMSGEGV